MKFLKSLLIIFLAAFYFAYSQTDTLVIKLKNNSVEKIPISQIKQIQFENVTTVADKIPANAGLWVNTNYPNPFQDQTNIEFEIASSGNVGVYVFDNNGNEIKKLECNNCQVGKNILIWNSTDKRNKRVESGTYYYEVRFNNEVISKKMLMIK